MARHLTPFLILAACAATAVWVICGVIPDIAVFRAYAASGTFTIVISAYLVRARGVAAPIKGLAVAVMAVCGIGLYVFLAAAVAGFLLTLGKWPALAVHFAGGMIQVALVLTLRTAGFVIVWRKRAEALKEHWFWKWVLKLGTLPAAILFCLGLSPIPAAFVVLFSGASQRRAWIYSTIAVAVTSTSIILFGDRIGLGNIVSGIFH